ncbi:MAG: elongation factor P maturation arginine rhamnosyltransferase EarP, partial [Burkholderiaceae bacterium]
MAGLSFDIFCRVVDNYGDIGVCWRLSRQLAAQLGQGCVRLWVDDLGSFARIEPGVDPQAGRQTVKGVDIVHWTQQPPPLAPHDVVIEAFACDPPADFIERMVGCDSLWINLEYLSAEAWVESCHALPSPQANGLRKAFFFPGFTPGTGGLLREPGLLARRDAWQADPS